MKKVYKIFWSVLTFCIVINISCLFVSAQNTNSYHIYGRLPVDNQEIGNIRIAVTRFLESISLAKSSDDIYYEGTHTVSDDGSFDFTVEIPQLTFPHKLLINYSGKEMTVLIDEKDFIQGKTEVYFDGVLESYTVNRENAILTLNAKFEAGIENRFATLVISQNTLGKDFDLRNVEFKNIDIVPIDYDGSLSVDLGFDSALMECFVYLITGNQRYEYFIDTSLSYSKTFFKESEITHITAFNLPDTYDEITSQTVKDRYYERKAYIPEEITVIKPIVPENENVYYVSPDAVDNGDGSFSQPYASLQEALDSLAASKKSGTVILRGGEYVLDKSVTIDSSHSAGASHGDITYICAYGDEEAVLRFGTKISADDFSSADEAVASSLVNETAGKKLLQIDLNNYGYTNFSDIRTYSLYINGAEMKKSRWPNASEVQMGEIIYPGFNAEGYDEWKTVYKSLNADKLSGWDFSKGIYFNGSFAFSGRWDKYITLIRNYDKETSLVTTGCSSTGMSLSKSNITHFYENIVEEIDVPGEWSIDKSTGMLYIYPTDYFSSSQIVLLGEGESLLTISNTKNLVFDGITFTYAQEGAEIINCEDVIFQNCSFNNIKNAALKFNSCVHSGVINSDFNDMGNKGIVLNNRMEFDDMLTDECVYNLVADRNFIQNCNISNVTSAAVADYFGIGNVISHNVIGNTEGTAIMISQSLENVTEYNEIYSFAGDTVDCGGIYCSGIPFLKGCHIRYNYVHDPVSGGVGIYFDDMSSNNMAYGNVIENCKSGITINGGKGNVAENNIIINGNEKFLDDYSVIRLQTNHYYDGIGNNPINFYEPNFINEDGRYAKFINSALYQSQTLRMRYPELFVLTEQINAARNERTELGESYVRSELTDTQCKENIVRASTDNYIANNLLIGEKPIEIERLYKEVWENPVEGNYLYNDGLNVGFEDFENRCYILNDDAEIFSKNENFEAVPFGKTGFSDNVLLKQMSDFEIYGMNLIEQTQDEGLFMLSWSPVSGNDFYLVTISSDATFENIINKARVYNEELEISLDSMVKSYYVRVEAYTVSKSYNAEANQRNMIFASNNEIISLLSVSDEGSTLSFTLCNNEDYDIKADIYVLQKNNGLLKSIMVFDDSLIEKRGTLKKSVGVIDKSGVKLFLWTPSLKPLIKPIELKNEE